MSHVMLDLETLGTTPGCAIVSIGACSFDANGLGEEFYRVIDITAPGASGSIDPSTVKWWMGQSDEARAVFAAAGIPLDSALHNFSGFWSRVEGTLLWGHGAARVLRPILDAAFSRCGLQAPVKFWDYRDTRTLYALADVKPERTAGTHHNALDDAKAQALAVIQGYKNLGKSL